MPRPPRLLVDDACYHILTRGNNRTAVFFQAATASTTGSENRNSVDNHPWPPPGQETGFGRRNFIASHVLAG